MGDFIGTTLLAVGDANHNHRPGGADRSLPTRGGKREAGCRPGLGPLAPRCSGHRESRQLARVSRGGTLTPCESVFRDCCLTRTGDSTRSSYMSPPFRPYFRKPTFPKATHRSGPYTGTDRRPEPFEFRAGRGAACLSNEGSRCYDVRSALHLADPIYSLLPDLRK